MAQADVDAIGVRVPSARQSLGGVTVSATGLRLGVLGEMTAAVNGSPVDLGGPRQRAVLALLVLARGDVVPADRLVDAVWGEQAPPSAASALQAYVSHLRRRLEPDRGPRDRHSVISRQGPGYALRVDDDAVDAWVFERLLRQAGAAPDPSAAEDLLEAALALWRGPAYADHLGTPWADGESTRLAGLRDVAREQRVQARLDGGESAVLVPEIEALVTEDPLREERWRLLVLALYRAHRQADALAALRRARATLAEELGVDPGPALRSLEAEVLAQSPGLDAPARPERPAEEPGRLGAPGGAPAPRRAPARRGVRAAARGPAPTGPVPPPGEEMVEREREVRRLGEVLAEAAAGEGRLALIEGPAGIGKTRLLVELRRMAAEHGALVLTARGSQLERDFAYGTVRQLFETTMADADARAEILTGSASAAAALFDDGHGGPAGTTTWEDNSFAILHGLYWVAVNLAGRSPLVLAVDDVQWCDAASVRALAFLLRRLEGIPVLLAVTRRSGEVNDLDPLLAELEQDPATVLVAPSPLGPDGTTRLVRARLGDAHPDFVAACHRTTGGNPLLLRQLLRALETEGVRPDASHAHTVNAIGSRAVSSMVLMRLARLPADCTAAARAVAVLGDGAPLPLAAELARLDEPAAAAAFAALARAEVVRSDHPVGFVHPLVREAVYQDLPLGERELAHERAAALLQRRESSPEQVAAHLMLAPPRASADAVAVLRRAAATAADRGATQSATTYLERALAEPPTPQVRPDVLIELGRLATMTDGPGAVRHLRAAFEVVTDRDQKRDVAFQLARTLVFAGGPGEAVLFAQEAIRALPDTETDTRQGLHALERVTGYMSGAPAPVWRREDIPLQGQGLGARMLAAALAFDEMIRVGDMARCVELARFALADGELQRHDPGLLWVVAAFVQEMAEEDLSAFWEQTLRDALARGSLFSALSVHLWRGYSLWHQGQLREALDSVSAANQQSEMWGNDTIGAVYGHAFAIGILLERGDVAEARALLDSIAAWPRFGDGGRLLVEAEGKLLAAEGRYEEALAVLDAAAAMMPSVENPVWKPWRTYRAPVLAALGRVEEARELMAEEIALSRRWGGASILGRTLRHAGELGGPGCEDLLREAVDLLGPSVARYELACAELALARVTGDPAQRRDLLHAALRRSVECGSAALYRDVASELAADGEQVARELAETPWVTSLERAMAVRAAAGANTATIAQELFLTPASVESALARLRDRLDVGTDAELVGALPR